VASAPAGIVLRRHRDLEGRAWHVWLRRALLALVVLIAVLGAFNVFGQRPQTSTAAGGGAELRVYAPERMRGGLISTARFEIRARRDIKDATLVFAPGWFEQVTFNGIAPQPTNFSSRNGRVAFAFGHVPAGQKLIAYVSFQTNPTNVGHRSQDVELDDGERPLARVHRTVTVFP
jgi:hypothetical protein